MSDKVYTIEEIKHALNEILIDKPVYQVILFGSYAKKKATKKSDIDLIIDTNSELKGFALLKLICHSLIGKLKKQGLLYMKNKEYMSLKKMLEYIDKALRYSNGLDFKSFSDNEEKVDATIFAISQIGELVKNISKDTMNKYPNIEWIIIKNLRNKIVHDYEGIKLNFIWDIITKDLIQLKADLEKIINDNSKIS